jgi:sortase A
MDVITEPTTTLPLPDPPPADPYAATPRLPIGILSIPKLGVRVELMQGITLTVIDRGAGHWPGTPMPGELGNMVIAGHRTLYQKPFARLNELVPGDKVLFDTVDGKHWTYEVRGIIIVPASHIGLASQHNAHTATLFACHPKGQATHRIVAKLMLLGPDGKPVDSPENLPPLDVGNRPDDDTLIVRDYGNDAGGGGGGDPLSAAQQ